MKRVWQASARILTGIFATAVCAMPQAYTISARPGVVNYIEGSALLNGEPVSASKLKSTFLNANDTLSTEAGKAEVLLTPGVFLRMGDNSEIRMVSPSLTDIQLQIERGEAMIEVDDLLKENRLIVLNHGGTIEIQKTGLYRFAADPAPAASVIEGKAEVTMGDRKVSLGKGKQTVIDAALKTEKFDTKKQDDLYAWSNVRSEYAAAASYQSAKNVSTSSYDYAGWGGLGFGGGYGPGWYWNSGFNSWAWLPMNAAFYSPFGYGFYGPAILPYAPVIVAPLYGGGGYVRGQKNAAPTTAVKTATVPISPKNPPAVGMAVTSPAANQAARTQAARSMANSGFRTATGAPAATFGGGRVNGGGVRMGGAPSTAGRTAGGNPGGGMRSAGGSFAGAGRAPGGAPSPSHK